MHAKCLKTSQTFLALGSPLPAFGFDRNPPDRRIGEEAVEVACVKKVAKNLGEAFRVMLSWPLFFVAR